MIDSSSAGYLHIDTSIPIEGSNVKQFHQTFIPLSDLIFTSVFTVAGVTIRGSWSSDGGDLAAPESSRERRYLCIKGKMTATFTGTAISVRTSLNPGWGDASVLIDGVAPSTIAGISNFKDTLTCNATTLGSYGNEFVDQVVADGLAPGTHTIELRCTSNSTTAFFVVAGLKSWNISNSTLSHSLWAVDWANRDQHINFTAKMTGTVQIADAQLIFDPLFIDAAGVPIGTKSYSSISGSSPVTINTRIKTLSTSSALSATASISLSYLAPDPAGLVSKVVASAVMQDDARITYGGAWWTDVATPTGYTETTRANGARTSWMMFPGSDTVSLRVWTDYGLTTAYIYKDALTKTGCSIVSGATTFTVPNNTGLYVGLTVLHTRYANLVTITAINGNTITTSAAATGTSTNQLVAFGFKIMSMPTTELDAALQRTYQEKPITGLPASYSGNILVQSSSAAGFGFTNYTVTGITKYTAVADTLSLNTLLTQVNPAPITDISLTSGAIVFTPPDYNSKDETALIPYDNTSTNNVSVEYRFPTFVTCYSSGFLELFKQYDIVITDPGALNRKEVIELQSLGIKVYMYVSFGEEDGEQSNKFDPSSAKGPYVGNGLGPGGTAGYYMKGGYQYGEQSECANDRQRLDNVKMCSVSNPKYYTGTGRCSKGCSKDWTTGYSAWVNGDACGGGYTSANNWVRDASVACSNSVCPGFAPLHSKCPQYVQAENVWGQDFSMLATTSPDENGIWSSYYVNAVDRGPGSWYDRLNTHYLPLVFNDPVLVVEEKPVATYLLSDGTTSVKGLLASSSFDEGYAFEVKDKITGYIYLTDVEYSYNKMTGAFTFGTLTAPYNTGYVVPSNGQVIVLTYYKRGLGADGVFMDTVDTVDVYPDPVYQQGAADLINDLKSIWAPKLFCSNRGFSIYPKMIQSCDMIMTESVFSDYNFATGTYQEVGAESAAYNESIAAMIQDLRKNHTFDVVCLNYAPNGAAGDAIRLAVQEKTLALGWMPWLSTILLNDPSANNRFEFSAGYIRRNEWKKNKIFNIRPV